MLQNLNPRERLMVQAIGGLLPLLGLVWAATSVSSAYFANRAKINTLSNQIQTEQDRQLDAVAAQNRRFYYRDRSFPADLNRSRVEYTAWLDGLLKSSQLTVAQLSPAANIIKARYTGGRNTVDVYEQLTFTARLRGTLTQWLNFKQKFDELDLMHRISSLKITPVLSGGSGGDADSRTGQLDIAITIQAIALVDAEQQRDFLAKKRELGAEIDEQRTKILARNIFGLANNPPRVGISGERFKVDTPISITVTGSDIDENDQLTLELISTNLPNAKLEQTSGRKTATITADPIPASELDEPNYDKDVERKYDLRIRVTDSGTPVKSIEKVFELTAYIPKLTREIREPPPPPFKYAQTAKITQTYAYNDVWHCEIRVLALNQVHNLKSGDSFELDRKKWTLREIDGRRVTFEIEWKDEKTGEIARELSTFRGGATLDKPISTTPILETKIPDEQLKSEGDLESESTDSKTVDQETDKTETESESDDDTDREQTDNQTSDG